MPENIKLVKATVGLDISMNFSGVTFIFLYSDNSTIVKYYAITPGAETVAPWIQNKTYGRIWDKDNYSIEEFCKILSSRKQAKTIHALINDMQKLYGFEHIDARMEGSIVNTGRFSASKARINDLTMFNCAIKTMLALHPLTRALAVIPPKTLKKLATGNGNANKVKMVEHFLKDRKELVVKYTDGKKTKGYKIDDVIDAFYLANCTYPDAKCFVK